MHDISLLWGGEVFIPKDYIMKYLRKFENKAAYSAYTQSQEWITPNVCYCVTEREVMWNQYEEPADTRLIAKFYVDDYTRVECCLYKTYDEEPWMEVIEIDGVVQPTLEQYYTFDTVGEHTVKYTLKDSTTIPDWAFEGCSIRSVAFPESVTNIGEGIFDKIWDEIRSVTISNNSQLILIPMLPNLTSVTYKGTQAQWADIDWDVFAYYEGWYDEWSEPSYSQVSHRIVHCTDGDIVLWERSMLAKFYVEDTSEPTRLFSSYSNVYDNVFEMEIDGAVPYNVIDEYTFDTVGEHIVIYSLDDYETIESSAFEGCRELSNITIPDSVTSIGEFAFRGCSGLTSIIIPDSVTSIGNSVFYECTSLSSVTIGSGVTYIDENAFTSCTSLSLITYQGTQSQWNQISLGYNWNASIPATVVHCTDGDVAL